MYVGALAMVPAVMALARLHPAAALASCTALYAANWGYGWGLPAEPGSEREWFFNPLAWQLLFFTGFGLSMGWVQAPPPSRRLLWVAGGIVPVSVPLAHWETAQHFEALVAFRERFWVWQDKTDFGLGRYVHFLALAYLAIAALKGREHLLLADWARPVIVVGRSEEHTSELQSLMRISYAVFCLKKTRHIE